MVLWALITLVGIHLIMQRRVFLLVKQILSPCWMKVVFGATIEMGVLSLEKVPKVSFVP